MIVIKLWGGLGNQMFQYAFGFSLAKKYKQELKFDFSFYSNQPGYTGKREIEINSLAVQELKKYEPGLAICLLSNRYVGAILRTIPSFTIPVGNGMKYIKEPIHKYIHNLECKNSVYYDGYWQSAKYFKDVRNELLIQYQPKAGFTKDEIDLFSALQSEESVAVHIRKGDFTQKSIRNVGHLLPISYYKKAMDYFRGNTTKPIFYIISDDTSWCKQQFTTELDVKYIADLHNGGTITDLFCIANCRNGIMSASTFSWWGNWLRKEPGKVVVPKGEYYNEFFYEPEWVQIDIK